MAEMDGEYNEIRVNSDKNHTRCLNAEIAQLKAGLADRDSVVESLRGALKQRDKDVAEQQALLDRCLAILQRLSVNSFRQYATHIGGLCEDADLLIRDLEALNKPADSDLLEAIDRSEPWPLTDVLSRLADAADHLLNDHGCDEHGYEEVGYARDAARRMVARLSSVSTGRLASEDDIQSDLDHIDSHDCSEQEMVDECEDESWRRPASPDKGEEE